MNKTKLVLLTAATLLAITSGAEAARVKRAKPSFSRPAPTQVQRAPAPVTNPVPGRPAVAQPATKPATQTAPAQNAAPANQAAPQAANQAAPQQQQNAGGGFVSNMMGAAVGAVAGSAIGDALFGDKSAEANQSEAVNVDAQPANANQAQPAAQAQQPVAAQ